MRLLLALIAAAPLLGQSSPPPGGNLYSLQQELDMGRRFGKTLMDVCPASPDPRLDAIGTALTSKIQDRHEFAFAVFERCESRIPREIFAFPTDWRTREFSEPIALPGGAIFVPRKLLNEAPNMEELSAIVAHSIGHVVLRHPTQMASLLGMMDLGSMPNYVESTPTEISKFSRTWELDADRYAVRLLKQLGFDPRALERVARRLPPPPAAELPLRPGNRQRLDAIDRAIRALP